MTDPGLHSSPLWPRVLGQDRVKRTLLSVLKADRLPHAYLFHGPEGVGKDATAIELARVLHCERSQTEACNECSSCLRMNELQHPDTRLIVALPAKKEEKNDDTALEKLTEPEMKVLREALRQKGLNPYMRVSIPRATVITINSIREIRREVSMSKPEGKWRIFIISRADMMRTEAASALMKTLEEPNERTLLVLTTSRPDLLLSTIRSRCQTIRFDRLTEEEIRSALMERQHCDETQATIVTRLADGSYTQALELLGEDLTSLREEALQFIRHVLGTNRMMQAHAVEALAAKRDREGVVRFLNMMLTWFRDTMVLPHGGDIVNVDQREDIERFLKNLPHANVIQVIAEIERAVSLIRRNVYITLALYNLSVHMRTNILKSS